MAHGIKTTAQPRVEYSSSNLQIDRIKLSVLNCYSVEEFVFTNPEKQIWSQSLWDITTIVVLYAIISRND